MKKIIDLLIHAGEFENVTNQYSHSWQYSNITKNNLSLYFNQMEMIKPNLLLVGEAPGYKGCRFTGIPFTSEFIIDKGIPEFNIFGTEQGYLTRNIKNKQKEATATIIWDVLKENRILPLLWNAFPFHPYKKNNFNSNRQPNVVELIFGINILKQVIKHFSIKRIIAVGNTSYKLMIKHDIECKKIRHPSNGGKTEFQEGIQSLDF